MSIAKSQNRVYVEDLQKDVQIDGNGPVAAKLIPFKENGKLGIEIETTHNYYGSDRVKDDVTKEFHQLAGAILKKNPKYTDTLYISPMDEQSAEIASLARTYSKTRAETFVESYGKKAIKNERLPKVRQWARNHPKLAKAIKWTAIGVGVGVTVYLGYQCYNFIQSAIENWNTMEDNAKWEQYWGYIQEGELDPNGPLGEQIVEGHEAYQDALEAYKESMEGAVTTGIGAGAVGGATTLGLIKQLRHTYRMAKNYNENERAVAQFLTEREIKKQKVKGYYQVLDVEEAIPVPQLATAFNSRR